MPTPQRTLHRALFLAVCALLVAPLTVTAPAWSETARPSPADRPEGGVSAEAARRAPGVTTLCTGYAGCRNSGRGNAGYAQNSGTMYWRMYSGHNCTNYAAYRMVLSGMPNTRPWSGGGNATYWGTSMPEITDKVPAVGAIAWWKANTGPAGSAGHVAYVEEVVSPDEIIISQDSWGGDFSWARVVKGTSWPSGFIHFNDVKLENTERPAVDGLARVGATLNASPGAWNPNNVTYSYEWRAAGAAIPNATGSTFTVRRAQEGQRIRVVVTASQPGYPTSTAASIRTPAVQPGQITNTLLPVISGTPKVDQPLSAGTGSWNPTPDSLTYQWFAGGRPIAGATSSTFVPGPAQVQQPLAVEVTAAKAGYDSVSARSISTAAVAPGTFTVARAARLLGKPRLQELVRLDAGETSPSEADVSVEWLRDNQPIPDATGPTYQPTVEDLGRRVAARMTLTREGYTPLVVRLRSIGTVRTEPRMKVRTKRPGRGKLTLDVRMRAAGLDAVPGTVQVVSGGEVLREIALRNGARTFTLRRLPEGEQRFTIRYQRTDQVLRTTTKRTLRIK